MRRTAISSSTNVPSRKKQRVMSADVQWCLNNKDTITLKSFAENFGLLERQYAVSRYTSIINSPHLAADQERLQSELDLLKKSEEFKLYWMERTRKRTRLDVDTECTEYVHDAAGRAMRALSSFFHRRRYHYIHPYNFCTIHFIPYHHHFYSKRYHENNHNRRR
ncbi:hypothetical protein BDF21DRAFT_332538 [Thamnidium elegans]|nr:hypothetical protein BDF21DRAFT_332538 [Thamnidium elegans]